MKKVILMIGLVLPSLLFAKTNTEEENIPVTANEVEPFCGALTQGYEFRIFTLKKALKEGSITDVEIDAKISELVHFKAQVKQACSAN